MEIKTSTSETKKAYVTEINTLIGDIRKASKKDVISDEAQIDLQVRLDTIADLYQEDESLGKSAYKMYYAQAMLHYYSGKTSLAHQFIDSAEHTYGSNFEAGDELREQIGSIPDKQVGSSAKNEIASSNRRLVNYIVDVVMGYVVIAIVVVILAVLDSARPGLFFDQITGASNLAVYLIVLTVFIHYYAFLEHSFGWTIGKLISKTRVVNLDGGQLSLGQVYKRTAARLIPFEAISFIGERPLGWHDKLSKTIVINKPKK